MPDKIARPTPAAASYDGCDGPIACSAPGRTRFVNLLPPVPSDGLERRMSYKSRTRNGECAKKTAETAASAMRKAASRR